MILLNENKPISIPGKCIEVVIGNKAILSKALKAQDIYYRVVHKTHNMYSFKALQSIGHPDNLAGLASSEVI